MGPRKRMSWGAYLVLWALGSLFVVSWLPVWHGREMALPFGRYRLWDVLGDVPEALSSSHGWNFFVLPNLVKMWGALVQGVAVGVVVWLAARQFQRPIEPADKTKQNNP